MNTNKVALSFCVIASLAATAAWPQATLYVRPAYQFPSGPPAAVQLGDSPVYATPFLGLAAGHDDNLFMSNANRRSSPLYVVSPGLKVDARDPNKVAQLNYQGQYGRYSDSEDDNYVDHNLNAAFDVAFDRRNMLHLGYTFIRGHDPRGSTDRPIQGHPDKYELKGPSASYAFGSPGAQGNLELYASQFDRRYLNNRETTFASDRKTSEVGGIFYWRAMPRTRLLLEGRHTDIDYDAATGPDSKEDRVYAGVTWDATAATTGTLKFGSMRKKFDSGLPSHTETSWEGLVTWFPRTYSRFDFYTARLTNESTGLGSFILTSVGGISWTHAWTDIVSTGVDLKYVKDDYQNFDRSDETTSLGFRVGYRFRRWLTLGAEYTHSRRDSNLPQFQYDRNLYLLSATASM